MTATAPDTTATAESGIRAARLTAGLSTRGLAAAAGVSPATIDRLENGRVRRPHRTTLAALAAALGCAVEDLGKGNADDGQSSASRSTPEG